MREKKKSIYLEMLNFYKENNTDESQILEELHSKPVCVHIDVLNNEYVEEHQHEYYELLYVEKGRIDYLLGNEVYNLLPGDILLIPPKTKHKLLAFLDNETSRFVLMCSRKFLKKHSTPQTNLLTVCNKAINNNIYQLKFNDFQKLELEKNLHSISKMMLENSFGIDLLYIHKFIKIIITIIDLSIQNDNEEELMYNKNETISRIIKYINDNLSKKIVIEDISNHLALSVSRISHIFKNETGISILKYINKKRLQLAKDLIQKGESFINISIKCGFQDYTSFFRTFKKEFNITPGEYSKFLSLYN